MMSRSSINVKNICLASYDDIFKTNEERNGKTKKAVIEISVLALCPFENHPFKLYEGERFTDMVESIKENGIIVPIIVRPLNDELYEILSGHNRVKAAKTVGLETIPAIIQADLDDDEALLIVTETNLRQRGFESLSHSEKAVSLKYHLDAIKKQGKRNDLINELNSLLNAGKTNENVTSDLLGHPAKSRDVVADKYGLSPTNVVRYIRLCELNKPLLNRVDIEEIGLYAAVSLSYLSSEEQAALNKILDKNKYKVDMKKAELMRDLSQSKKLTAEKIEQILSGELNKKPRGKSPAPFKIKYKIYSKYFDETIKHDEAESIIDKALDEYFKKHI